MAMKEDHLSKDIAQNVCAVFGAAKLLFEGLDVVNFDALNIFHEDGTLRALEHVNFWHIQVVTSADITEVINCFLRVYDLGLEVQFLDKALLEVIEEFVEVDSFVVVSVT